MVVLRSIALAAVGYLAVVAAAYGRQPGELIERTLAIVDGQVITLADVQVATALGLIASFRLPDDLGKATEALIDRALMLREVQRYSPPEPKDDEVIGRLAAIRRRFADPDAFAAALAAGGFTEQRLQSWIRDDLRIAAYLNQRFADERRDVLIADWIADLRRRTPIVQLWK